MRLGRFSDRSRYVRRRDENDELRAAHNVLHLSRCDDRGRQLYTREKAIAMRVVHGLRDVRLIRPQPHLVGIPRQPIGERGTPCTGAQHSALHRDAPVTLRSSRCAHHVVRGGCWPTPSLLALLKRCSSPRRSRPMLARCVKNTNSATIIEAMKNGSEIATPLKKKANGSARAALSDATLT